MRRRGPIFSTTSSSVAAAGLGNAERAGVIGFFRAVRRRVCVAPVWPDLHAFALRQTFPAEKLQRDLRVAMPDHDALRLDADDGPAVDLVADPHADVLARGLSVDEGDRATLAGDDAEQRQGIAIDRGRWCRCHQQGWWRQRGRWRCERSARLLEEW